MAFPAITITHQEAWNSIRNRAKIVEAEALKLSQDSAAGVTDRTRYRGLLQNLRLTIASWDQSILDAGAGVAVTGRANLQAYARSQPDISDTFVFNDEFDPMRQAADDLATWIFGAIPKSGTTPLLQGMDSDGNLTELTFNTTATAQFRTNVTTFEATII